MTRKGIRMILAGRFGFCAPTASLQLYFTSLPLKEGGPPEGIFSLYITTENSRILQHKSLKTSKHSITIEYGYNEMSQKCALILSVTDLVRVVSLTSFALSSLQGQVAQQHGGGGGEHGVPSLTCSKREHGMIKSPLRGHISTLSPTHTIIFKLESWLVRLSAPIGCQS